jgi:hypothetical protein
VSRITPETIEKARQVRDALDAALKQIEAGDIDVDQLGELPEVTLDIQPARRPSSDVAQAIAASTSARKDYADETDRSRALVITLAVGAEVAKALLPMVGKVL